MKIFKDLMLYLLGFFLSTKAEFDVILLYYFNIILYTNNIENIQQVKHKI